MTDPVLVPCPSCGSPAGDQCRTVKGKTKAFCKVRGVAGASPARVSPADFDENTPPPRRRPEGEPVPRVVALPAGESPAQLFAKWDRDGRIPPRSVLCRFVGSGFDFDADVPRSGYVVEAVSETGTTLHTELGAVEEAVPVEKLGAYDTRCEVRHGRKVYMVFSPKGGG